MSPRTLAAVSVLAGALAGCAVEVGPEYQASSESGDDVVVQEESPAPPPPSPYEDEEAAEPDTSSCPEGPLFIVDGRHVYIGAYCEEQLPIPTGDPPPFDPSGESTDVR